jgi:hypothetical protein
MDFCSFRKKTFAVLLAGQFMLGACVSEDAAKSSKRFGASTDGKLGATTTGSGAGNTTSGGTGGVDTDIPPKVEIRNLIEPNLSTDPTYSPGTGYVGGGSYVRKLTLPKNYAGRLYVAGININTLAARNVKVRFKFGLNSEPVEIPATVSKAPGITPQTNVDVLILDLKSEPFRNIRLIYDLFDYNDYSSSGATPVQDNRDTGLYCRALKLEHDPTFNGVGACDAASEDCLYSYAKLSDQGLLKETQVTTNGVTSTVYVPVVPSTPQLEQGTNGYYGDLLTEILKRPLQDDYTTSGANFLFTLASGYTFSQAEVAASTVKAIGTFGNYMYKGPYGIQNCSEWHFNRCTYGVNDLAFISANSDFGIYKNKLFKEAARLMGSNTLYYKSYMFPLATKIKSLQAGVEYLGSDAPFDLKTPQGGAATVGESKWIDGVNARVTKNYDGEHVGSCNVTATMEIVAKDDNGNWYVVSESKDIKLQLVRPTQYSTELNDNVLYQNFKTCSSNSMCGSSECCYNNRCWDETLVSQCIDNSSHIGNKPVGDVCTTDVECQSLCCNRTSGKCAVHNTLLNPQVLCQKPIGDFCIAKEWCQKTPVTTYLIVRTGTDLLGNVTCALRSYVKQEYGDCKNGVCVAPPQSSPPPFDVNNPDCSNAVTAPNF